MKRDIESFGSLYGRTYEALLGEGILNLPSSIIAQIEHEIIPGLRKLCIRDNITNSAIVDMVKLLSPNNLNNWELDDSRSPIGLKYKCPNLSITGKPINSDTTKTWPLHLIINTIPEMASLETGHSRGAYDIDKEVIRISVLTVTNIRSDEIYDLYDMIQSGEIESEFLQWVADSQRVFTERVVQGLSRRSANVLSMTAVVQKTFGFKNIQEVLEHELIHAIDPTISKLRTGTEATQKTHDAINQLTRQLQSQGKSPEEINAKLQDILRGKDSFDRSTGVDAKTIKTTFDFRKNRQRYNSGDTAGYYRTPGFYAGKTPIEYNPNFWNIIRKYDTPLSEEDKQQLITFLKSPIEANMPNKLVGFKSFIKAQLMHKNTRRKFLQRLGAWVAENSQKAEE
jgi:hypothetical protein